MTKTVKKKKSGQEQDAESRSRAYTKEELKKLGWNTKHPKYSGNVLEEKEAKHYDNRFDKLLGNKRPDFLLYLDNEPVLIIECKSKKEQIDEAVNQGIKEYAERLSAKVDGTKYFDIRLVTGVAGNEDSGVSVKNYYKDDNGKWNLITGNKYPLTQILTKNQLNQVLLNEKATIDLTIPTESEFYSIAENINQILHEAKVNKSDRAVYLGAITLALKAGTVDRKPGVIINQINANVASYLDGCGKGDLKHIFQIHGNSDKLKEKLPLVFHNLDRLNLTALMNTGTDVLGKFFETFLRYGNDAKELGIVFTPRHIVNFMCDLVDIQQDDIVYDPACGTGGFLVAAFTKMKDEVGNDDTALENIKVNQLIGCDSDDSGKIPALAVINMIFRGDGRTNIYNANCFKFTKFQKRFATKVLMNPPYAQTSEPETMFIDHGLEALKPGKLFAAIFTYSVLCDKPTSDWRKNLLHNHTVLGVITMPSDLFYPTSANTCILICKAHTPHIGKIWFCRIENDGYKIKRKKRVERDGGQLEKALKMFKLRETHPELSEEPGFSCYTELDPNDEYCEIVPEAYLASPEYSDNEIHETVESLLRESAAFGVKYYPKLIRDD